MIFLPDIQFSVVSLAKVTLQTTALAIYHAINFMANYLHVFKWGLQMFVWLWLFQTKTGIYLLQDGSEEPFNIRLHLAKDILTIQEQDVICVSGEPFYSSVSSTIHTKPDWSSPGKYKMWSKLWRETAVQHIRLSFACQGLHLLHCKKVFS